MNHDTFNLIKNDDNLKANEKYFYMLIVNYASDKGYAYPSYVQLMKDMNTTKRLTISCLIKRLEQKGYIRYDKGNSNSKANAYYPLKYLVSEQLSTSCQVITSGKLATSGEIVTSDEKVTSTSSQKVTSTSDQRVTPNINKNINENIIINENRNTKENIIINENRNIKNNNNNNNTNNNRANNRNKGFNNLIRAYTNNQNLIASIIDFIKMRKAVKRPLTDRGLSLIFSKLDELSNNNESIKIDILNQSIEHSWQGVFPLKGYAANNKREDRKVMTMEDKFNAVKWDELKG